MSEEKETRIFLNSITTNVSEFFRDKEQLSFLKKSIFPMSNKSLNILSAGCSTGEEPYTLAMILSESMKDYKIDAIDVNNEVIEFAKRGSYRLPKIDKIPEFYRNKYLRISKDGFSIRELLKEKVSFTQKNILSSYDVHRNYDFIFCKNVLIYFGVRTRRIVINEFENLLKNGGYLVMGSSETLIGLQEESFEYTEKNIYRKRD